MLYQLYYSPFPKLEGFLIKNLDKVYPYVVAYMTFQTNLQLIIYNEFLSTTLVEVTLVLPIHVVVITRLPENAQK